ncbi:MAG: hypothetical protein J6N45_05940 [Alphaproteobacteria bacterium]|nr:hypothetical protein [Alphaproteobacteria bacterium]
MKKRILPSLDEIMFAISEEPLGMGEEAKVYKIHTNPDYTVRVSNNAPDFDQLSKIIENEKFVEQKDIFAGRNYAQPVAYLGLDKDSGNALVTLNLYSPGFSMEIYKPGRKMPSSNEALMKTRALSEAIVNMPDSAIDKIYDDLHFLSSREYSIDVGNGGLFTNTGNILYSAVDKEFRIIDLQAFIKNRVGIPPNHTKGFNTPLFLTRGLIPGAYGYADEHASNPDLIAFRTEIIDKIIRGAQRNNLNDEGGYLRGNRNEMAHYWQFQLKKLQIPEKYQETFIKDISAVKQEHRYRLVRQDTPLVRVAGRSMCS